MSKQDSHRECDQEFDRSRALAGDQFALLTGAQKRKKRKQHGFGGEKKGEIKKRLGRLGAEKKAKAASEKGRETEEGSLVGSGGPHFIGKKGQDEEKVLRLGEKGGNSQTTEEKMFSERSLLLGEAYVLMQGGPEPA